MGFMLGAPCSPCCGDCDLGDIILYNRRSSTPSLIGVGPDLNLIGPNYPLTTRTVDSGWEVFDCGSAGFNCSARQGSPTPPPWDEIPDYPDGKIARRDMATLVLQYTASECRYSYRFAYTRFFAWPFRSSSPQFGTYSFAEIDLFASADSIAIFCRGYRGTARLFYNPTYPLLVAGDCNTPSIFGPRLEGEIICTNSWNNLDRDEFINDGPLTNNGNFKQAFYSGNTPAEDSLACEQSRVTNTGAGNQGSPCFYSNFNVVTQPCGTSPGFPNPFPTVDPDNCSCATGAITATGVCPGVLIPV
jgi:hypothetical protein